MKFSKSILLFLFFSSLVGAFFYALDRTNGNVFKSLQFALFFLAIKIGLIGPNLPLKLDYHQPNQQLLSRGQTLPIYNLYGSILDDYHPSGLYMNKIQRPVPQHYVSDHSQSVINDLRAGSRLTEAAWLLILDVATTKCGLSAGKTSTTASRSSVIWRYFKFPME
jgi:hypothetical protein